MAVFIRLTNGQAYNTDFIRSFSRPHPVKQKDGTTIDMVFVYGRDGHNLGMTEAAVAEEITLLPEVEAENAGPWTDATTIIVGEGDGTG